MKLLNCLRFINSIILACYCYFLIKNDIRLNLLTVVPVITIFIYEILMKICLRRLKEYDES